MSQQFGSFLELYQPYFYGTLEIYSICYLLMSWKEKEKETVEEEN